MFHKHISSFHVKKDTARFADDTFVPDISALGLLFMLLEWNLEASLFSFVLSVCL